ncbi:MAG: hypothetical protein AAF492_01065, partial [Verrucomicrobiota bacterium]
MKKRMLSSCHLLSLTFALSLPTSLHALLIVAEDFTYPDGNFDGSQNGGTDLNPANRWTGPWAFTGQSSGGIDAWQVNANRAHTVTGAARQTGDLTRDFTSDVPAHSTLYFRFVVNWQNDNEGAYETMVRFLGGQVEIGLRNDAFQAVLGGDIQAVGNQGGVGIRTLVGRVEFNPAGNETLTFWINPVDESSPPIAVASADIGQSDLGTQFIFRKAAQDNNNVFIDDFQLGSDFDFLTAPDLRMTKTVDFPVLTSGSNLVYTLEVLNQSGLTALGVSVTDTLPAAATFIGSSPSVSTQVGFQYGFNLGSLPVGSSSFITITAAVNPSVAAMYTNVATVANTNQEANASDNTDTAVTLVPDPNPPYVDNAGGATAIGDTSADLNGTLVSTGTSASAVFVTWGPTDGGAVLFSWANTNAFGVNLAAPPVPYNLTATGLTPHTTYFYRYWATNSSGTHVTDSSATFRTLGPPEVNNDGGASGLGDGIATLNGTMVTSVNADAFFYWGLSDGGTNASMWDQAVPLGPAPEGPFSNNLSGLIFGLEYFYRTYATNLFGDDWADSTTNFKTALPAGVLLTNGQANPVGLTNAVLNLTFNGTNSVFDLIALWGPTDGGTNLFTWSNRVSLGWFTNSPLTNLSVAATNLQSNALHYFTFVATNCAGNVWALPPGTFNTKGDPGVINLPGPSPVANGITEISGTLTNGGTAWSALYWGRTDGGMTMGAWENNIVIGPTLQSDGPFFGEASNLTYGVCYVYRAFASNTCGEAWASSATVFTARRPFQLSVPGLNVREYDFDIGVSAVNPISNLQGTPPDGTSIQVNNLNYGGPAGAFAALTANTTIMLLWEGYFVPTAGAGNYSFALDHDDHAVWVIDLNDDGVFDDGVNYQPGERVVDAHTAGCCGQHFGTVPLENRPYRMAIGWRQGGGGVRIRARWNAGNQIPFNSMTLVNGSTGNFFAERTEFIGLSNSVPMNISPTTAVIQAEFEGLQSVFDVYAYWGLVDGTNSVFGWSNSTFVGTFSNTALTNLSVAIGGLLTNSDYYYTFRMTNCVEDTWAQPSVPFSTVGPPLVDNGGGAIPNGEGAAILNGNLLNGGAADVTIYWGLTDGGTTPGLWDASNQLGTVLQGPVSAPVSNLIFGVPYYYRTYATNSAGLSWAGSGTVFKVDPYTVQRAEGNGLLVREYDTVSAAGNLEPLSLLQGIPENNTSIQTDIISYYQAQIVNNFAGIVGADTFSLLWEGVFVPDAGAGDYTFGMVSDDRGVIYIDLNGDGDFDDGVNADPGEKIMDRGCCAQSLVTVNLPEDRPYRFAIAMQENAGGQIIEAKWRAGTWTQYGDLNFVDGNSDAFFLDFVPLGVTNRPP